LYGEDSKLGGRVLATSIHPSIHPSHHSGLSIFVTDKSVINSTKEDWCNDDIKEKMTYLA
jgi:hypothetical protein